MEQTCTYCQKSLGLKSPKVQCSECPPSRLAVFCLECFSHGVEAGQHRASHDYQIINEDLLRIFEGRNNWTTGEVVTLLEAIELFNFGNWSDISDHVLTKSSTECLDFYSTYFINGNIGRVSFHGHLHQMAAKDHTESSKEAARSQQLPELSVQEQQDVGYMALRDDFEQEYDNLAESEMVNLEISVDDDDADAAYKLFKMETYCDRLKERERRKAISKDCGILFEATAAGARKASMMKKKLTKEERDLKEKVKLFARFQKNSKHEQMFHSLLKLKRMKSRIRDLQNFRRNGINKSSDCDAFETSVLQREKHKELFNKMNSSNTSSIQKRDRDSAAVESRSLPPKFDLLRPGEVKLCKALSLDPTSYIATKLCVLSDIHLRKYSPAVKLRFPSDMDKSSRKKMVDFFTANRWIPDSLPLNELKAT